MTTDRRAALVERVARAMFEPPRDRYYRAHASAALDLALEEAAQVASDMWVEGHGNLPTEPYAAAKQVCAEIAAAIRALKSAP